MGTLTIPSSHKTIHSSFPSGNFFTQNSRSLMLQHFILFGIIHEKRNFLSLPSLPTFSRSHQISFMLFTSFLFVYSWNIATQKKKVSRRKSENRLHDVLFFSYPSALRAWAHIKTTTQTPKGIQCMARYIYVCGKSSENTPVLHVTDTREANERNDDS